MIRKIDIQSLVRDERCQQRTKALSKYVKQLAGALLDGGEFRDPIIVFRDEQGSHYLADGFCRVAAAALAGVRFLSADIRIGGLRDAILYSVGANAEHGMRRTSRDLWKAIRTMLLDPEWVKWPDLQIAKAAMCSHTTVGKVRRSLEESGEIVSADVRLTVDGKHRPARNRRSAETARLYAVEIDSRELTPLSRESLRELLSIVLTSACGPQAAVERHIYDNLSRLGYLREFTARVLDDRNQRGRYQIAVEFCPKVTAELIDGE